MHSGFRGFHMQADDNDGRRLSLHPLKIHSFTLHKTGIHFHL